MAELVFRVSCLTIDGHDYCNERVLINGFLFLNDFIVLIYRHWDTVFFGRIMCINSLTLYETG